MLSLTLLITTSVSYLLAALYQGYCVKQRYPVKKPLLMALACIAVSIHALSLPMQLFVGNGLSLGIFNSLSLLSAAITSITLLACLRLPLENLLLLLLPLGLISVNSAYWITAGTEQPIHETPAIFAHILLSFLAYGLLTIAAMQALLLLLQQHQLKHKHSNGITRNFPPIQTMESLLFGYLWAGFGLLSLGLLSGWIFVDNLFAQHLGHKAILSCLAWAVFAILLIGRYYLGWRGSKAIRWTLTGFGLLVLAYFGSKFVYDFIIN